MKAVGIILKSCFDCPRFVFWLWFCGLMIFVCFMFIGLATHGAKEISFLTHPSFIFWPLFGSCFTVAAVGWNLRQTLLEGEETDMLPDYQARHLKAAGVIIAANTFVYLALTLLCGWQPLPALASLLCIAAFTLWFGVIFLVMPCLVFCLLGLADGLFPEKSISDTLAETYQTLWTGFAAHAYVWSGLLIVLSLCLIILFCIRYLSITCASSGYSYRLFMIGAGGRQFLQPSQRVQLTKTATPEKKESRADMSVRKAVFQMAAKRHVQPLSFFQSARLIRFAMSGAQEARGDHIQNWNSNWKRVSTAFYSAFAIIFYGILFKDAYRACSFMPIIFGILVTTIAITFQSNKNQLPALYLQMDMPSKSAFMKAVAACYLLLNAEFFLIFTAAAMAAYFFIPGHIWPFMFQVILINAATVLLHASILFTTCNQRKAPPGRGYYVWFSSFLLLLLVILLPVVAISIKAGWITTGICVIVSALIFYAALRHWTKSEMDCA